MLVLHLYEDEKIITYNNCVMQYMNMFTMNNHYFNQKIKKPTEKYFVIYN